MLMGVNGYCENATKKNKKCDTKTHTFVQLPTLAGLRCNFDEWLPHTPVIIATTTCVWQQHAHGLFVMVCVFKANPIGIDPQGMCGVLSTHVWPFLWTYIGENPIGATLWIREIEVAITNRCP